MASNPDFVQYIADQCAGAGEITVKKMFGDYGIYCDGKKIEFKVQAHCGDTLLGEGTHLRFIVDRNKFMSRL